MKLFFFSVLRPHHAFSLTLSFLLNRPTNPYTQAPDPMLALIRGAPKPSAWRQTCVATFESTGKRPNSSRLPHPSPHPNSNSTRMSSITLTHVSQTRVPWGHLRGLDLAPGKERWMRTRSMMPSAGSLRRPHCTRTRPHPHYRPTRR